MIILKWFNILVFILSIKSLQVKGETCKTSDLRSGTCLNLSSCPVAQQMIISGSNPTFCTGQQNHLVCCPSSENTNENEENEEQNNKENPCDNLLPLGSGEDIAENKCIEYSHLVCERITPPTLTSSTSTVLVNRCGHKVTPLIVGGVKAQNREFPHMARLGYGEEDNIKWACGGTLISDNYVLTAAHCLQDKNYGLVNFIRLGVANFDKRKTENFEFSQQFTVADRLRHPEYKSNSKYYDIALVKLDKKAILNKQVIPACLPKISSINKSKAIATGWGFTEDDGNSSEVLMKVVLEFFTHMECSQVFNTNRELRQGINDSIQICAGSHSEEKDTCQGDSGGPLQVYRTSPYCMYDVIGVTSFGKACAVINRPAVYSRVAFAKKWIIDNVWPE